MEINFDLEQLFTLTYSCQPLKILLDKLVNGHNMLVQEIKDIHKKLDKEFIYKFNLIDDRLHVLEDETVKHRTQIYQHSNTLIRHGDMLEEHDAILKNFKGLPLKHQESKDYANSEEITELRHQLALMDETVKSQETILVINTKIINEYKQTINNIYKVSSDNLGNAKSNQESLKSLESKMNEIEHNLNTKANNDELNKLFQMIMETQKQAIDKMCVYESKLNEPKSDPVVTEEEMILIRNEIKKIDKISNQCTEIKDIINDMDIEGIKSKLKYHTDILKEKAQAEEVEFVKSEMEAIRKKIEVIEKLKPVVIQQPSTIPIIQPQAISQPSITIQKEIEEVKLSLNILREEFNNLLKLKGINYENEMLTLQEKLKGSIEELAKLKGTLAIVKENHTMVEIQVKKNSEDCSNLFNILSKSSKDLPQVTVVREQSSVTEEMMVKLENKINSNFNILNTEVEKLVQEINELKSLKHEITYITEAKSEKVLKEQKTDINANFNSSIKELIEKELEEIKAKIQQNELSNTKLMLMVKELETNLLKRISENQGILEKGTSQDDIDNLRNEIKTLIESLLIGIQKKFADSNETRQALKLLEKQIKYLLRRRGKKSGGNGAMFTKKQLLPWTCASCEKDLVNLESKVARFYNWNKMPAREVNARLKSMMKTSSVLANEEGYIVKKKSILKPKFPEGSDNDKTARFKNLDFNVEGEFSQRPSTALFTTPTQFLKKKIPIASSYKPN